ncbi:sigma-70 family RNA polymerase sigma factor [Kineococcus sp. T13]|uniref:RNA polymerase sigma factor n=1 Tax=Kineococcus vitellinus TaxID=2696565 RepID=UPI0014129864|nr:sigma-70 family RNA polymerase sigma factor [Kineococcus vitellinus]NAZ77089.1 sigma-70 family RNA polymerase sigma factor [Kineococcus vitellinus]
MTENTRTSGTTRSQPRSPSLAAAQRGEAGAWELLVQRWQPLVAATVRQQGLGAGECEDVVQTVWLRLFTGIDCIRDQAALPGWLVTTSRREAWAAARRGRRELPCAEPFPAEPSSDCDDVFRAVRQRLALSRLRPCVALLPERERRLVEALLDPREPTYREISHRLDMPVGAIGPVRRRAVQRLRLLLEHEDRELPAAS